MKRLLEIVRPLSFLLVPLFLFLPNCLLGQTLSRVATIPTPANLSGVWFTSPTDGWAAGDRHTLLRTTDHGVTWNPVAIPGYSTEPLYDVVFINSTLGFATGNSADVWQDILRTNDGGATWQQVSNFPMGGSWRHIQFVNATTGFIGSNGGIVRTTNSGDSWSLRSGYPDCPIIYGMRFIDANTGVVGGYQLSTDKSGIFKTTDGGVTWTLKREGNINDVVYLSSSTLIACDGTEIIRSVNGGETWSPIATLTTGIASLTKAGTNVVVAVSTGGDISRSADGGLTWSLRVAGLSDLPAMWRVRFLDDLNGHVVGQGGAIYETADGGVTWTALNRGYGRNWNAIVAFSDDNILLGGLHGYVQSTTDGGSHWASQLLDPPTFNRDTSFSTMSMSGPDSVVVAGHWGSLFKTTDRGATWTNLSNSVNPSFYANGIKFTDANNGWLVGWDYNTGPKSYVRRTTNGGLTWSTVDAVNYPSMDVEFIGQTGWILSGGVRLSRTVDGGANWSTIALPLNSGIAPNCYQMGWGTSSVGYICGFDGYLIKTTNGGTSWTQLEPTNVGFVYLGVVARGDNEVWVCGAQSGGGNAIVKRSLDGGVSWQTFTLRGEFTTPYRMVRTASRLYVTGYDGGVWRMDVAGETIPSLTALSFSPSPVVGGTSTTGMVTLSGPAPPSGFPVVLTSTKAVVKVPVAVTVPEGASSATFTAETSTVISSVTATVTAKANGLFRSTALTVVPLLKSISASPSSLPGGKSSTGKVTLNGPAPTGGIVASISTTNPAATVPSTVTVPAGATSATFAINTAPVSATTSGTITVQYGGVTRSVNFTVKRAALSSLAIKPMTIKGTLTATGTVTLTGAAPAGGITVSLTSSDPAVASLPASVTVPAGQSSAAFAIKTFTVGVNTAVGIGAVLDGLTKTRTLTVTP